MGLVVSTGEIVGATTFADFGMIGGGFINGIDIANGGAMVCGCDTNSAYYKAPGDIAWRNITSSYTADPADYATSEPKTDGFGACAAIAPTDPNYVVVGWNGYFYYSTNAGVHITKSTSIGNKRLLFNSGATRLWNNKIRISPANKNHVLMGTFNDGVYYTTDFFSTTHAVNGTIPATAAYGSEVTPYLVEIAPNGTAYIFVPGTGLYKATSVSGTFTRVTGGPAWASIMMVDADGVVWIIDPTSGAGVIFKCTGTTWSSMSTGGMDTPNAVAVDPADTNHIVFCNSDGALKQSYDGGATVTDSWFSLSPAPNGAGIRPGVGDSPWMAYEVMFPTKLMFVPDGDNKLYMPNGIGVIYSEPPASYIPWDWITESRGIRQMVCNQFLSVPGKDVFLQVWDKGTWQPGTDPGNPDTIPKFPSGIGFSHHWQADYAVDDNNYLAGCGGNSNDGRDNSWFSTNGGSTLQKLFTTNVLPSGDSGTIVTSSFAMSNKANQIIVPGFNQQAIYTTNEWGGVAKTSKVQGVDWEYLPIPVRNTYGPVARQPITSDKERAGVFAAVVSSAFTGQQGLYVSTNGGVSWTKKIAGQLNADPSDSSTGSLKYIPGKSGELLYTSGGFFNSALNHYTNDATSGGGTALGDAWGVTKVSRFGFGKALEGQSYPSLYFVGYVDGQYGVYRTCDWFATAPDLLEIFAGGGIDEVTALSGDMNVFGRVFVGYYGSGAVWGHFQDLCTAH